MSYYDIIYYTPRPGVPDELFAVHAHGELLDLDVDGLLLIIIILPLIIIIIMIIIINIICISSNNDHTNNNSNND